LESGNGGTGGGRVDDLLEEYHKDERGQLFTAVSQISVDMFDCQIPVKVFANDIGSAASSTPHGGWVV